MRRASTLQSKRIRALSIHDSLKDFTVDIGRFFEKGMALQAAEKRTKLVISTLFSGKTGMQVVDLCRIKCPCYHFESFFRSLFSHAVRGSIKRAQNGFCRGPRRPHGGCTGGTAIFLLLALLLATACERGRSPACRRSDRANHYRSAHDPDRTAAGATAADNGASRDRCADRRNPKAPGKTASQPKQRLRITGRRAGTPKPVTPPAGPAQPATAQPAPQKPGEQAQVMIGAQVPQGTAQNTELAARRRKQSEPGEPRALRRRTGHDATGAQLHQPVAHGHARRRPGTRLQSSQQGQPVVDRTGKVKR